MLATAHVSSTVRSAVSRWLEDGVLSGPASRALARVHGALASQAIARPLRIDPGIFSVTVGGATLGGSGKTRVALACVEELAARGLEVVLIGHGYRSLVRARGAARPRVVSPSDSLADVGDEALACARALAASGSRARVVIGPTRQAAVDFASSLALGDSRRGVEALVIDGALQLAPARSSLSLLAVDAAVPWGAGAVAPAGDLRAPPEALLAAADHVAPVDATPRSFTARGVPAELASLARSRGSRATRVGLFTAIARPARLERALVAAGLDLAAVVRATDHGPLLPSHAREIARAGVDIWLATAKCALHLEALEWAVPLGILDGSTLLSPSIVRALDACAGGRGRRI